MAEDNDNNRMVAELILKRLGLDKERVDYTADGAESLECLRSNNYHLIFLDIQMPHVDGFDVCQQLRNSDDFATPCDAPVVAISAHAHPTFRDRAFMVGMNDFITKPYTKADVRRVLERFTHWKGN